MSITNMELLDEQIEYNPEAESTSFTKLPDATYLMELSLGKNGINVKKNNAGQVYLDVHVQGRVVAPGERFDNYKASGFITSNTFKDGTSPVQQLLLRAGQSSAFTTARELADAVELTLTSTPQLYTRVRWEANGKLEDGSWKRYKGMRSFPKDASGNPIPEVEIGGEMKPARETIYGFVAAPQAGVATS